jgi:hypothetical protein
LPKARVQAVLNELEDTPLKLHVSAQQVDSLLVVRTIT